MPIFGPSGEIFFRHTEGSSGFVYRVRPDGTGLRKALEQPVLTLSGVSPDGRWIAAWAPLPGNEPAAVQLFPLGGGSPVVIGGNTWLQWSQQWRLSVDLRRSGSRWPDLHRSAAAGQDACHAIPPGGFRSEQEIARLPGARRIDAAGAPGPSR